MAIWDRFSSSGGKLPPDEQRLKELLDEEFAASRALKRLFVHEHLIRQKKKKLEQLKDRRAPKSAKFDEIAAIITTETNIIRQIKGIVSGKISLGHDVEGVIKAFSISNHRLIEAAKKDRERLRAMIRDVIDREAIELYRDVFRISLQAERIGSREFQDQERDLEIENVEEKILEHLLINLDKQNSAVGEMKKYLVTNKYDPVSKYNSGGRNLFDMLTKLIEEEERFFQLLVTDGLVVMELETSIMRFSKLAASAVAAKKVRLKALVKLSARGSALAGIIIGVLYSIGPTEPGKSRVDITKEIEGRRGRIEVQIEQMPAATKKELERQARNIAEKETLGSPWCIRYFWDDKETIAFIDAEVEVWTEQIYRDMRKEWEDLKYKYETENKTTIEVKLNEKEVKDAIRQTLQMMKPQILRSVKPKNLSELIAITGGSPRITGEVEQRFRKYVVDRAEPIIDNLKNEIRKRVKILLIPEILRRFDPELREVKGGTIYNPKYLNYLILFMVLAVSLEIILNLPLVRLILRPRFLFGAIRASLKLGNTFTTGFLRDIYEILTGKKCPV